MQDAIDRLVSATYSDLAGALAAAAIAGAPLARTRSVERAIEALAGYALGVFAAGVAARLAVGADFDRARAIRTALFRATAQLAIAPIADVDALPAGLVYAGDLRVRVAARLRESRADAVRVVAALVAAGGPASPSGLDELAACDLAATRFREHVERIWALLHGGTTYVAPPKPAPAYCAAG